MWWTILFILAFVRAILSFFQGWLVHMFVHSRPPGRKMVCFSSLQCECINYIFKVTTDINVFAHIFGDLAVICNCIEAMSRAFFGPLPFSVVFGFNQVYKITTFLVIGVLNVSGFLQFAIIANQRFVK